MKAVFSWLIVSTLISNAGKIANCAILIISDKYICSYFGPKPRSDWLALGRLLECWDYTWVVLLCCALQVVQVQKI